tara:strand:+ start:396 stop:1061 length:666 start_codon:yes stop_codon:yes gene_type:complete
MKLLLENWREYQLLTEAQDIRSLYESGQITEGEYLDKIKRFAKKKGIPIALALSLAGGVTAAAKAQTAQSWDDWHKEAIVAQAEYEEQHGWRDDWARSRGLDGKLKKKIQDYPLEAAPTLGGRGTGKGFLYVPAKYIPDNTYLSDNSGYETAGDYRKAVSNNSEENLKKQLFRAGSGPIFGGGTARHSIEFEKTKDGKKILPLEWSLSYEAIVNSYIERQP